MAHESRLGIVGLVAKENDPTAGSRPREWPGLMIQVENATTIGRSLRIRGELTGENDLLVEGDFEGVIRLAGSHLTVQPEGHVRAVIQAQDLTVLGRVEGEIRVAGNVDLRSGSVVLGEIFAARISIEEGAVLLGRFDPSRSAEPLPESTSPISKQLEVLNQTLSQWAPSASRGVPEGTQAPKPKDCKP